MKPDATAAILAAIAELQAEVRRLRAEVLQRKVQQKKPREVRMERRHARIRELAAATGHEAPWRRASEVLLILCGRNPCPPGMGKLVDQLQRDGECPKSVGGLYRVISGEGE